MYFLPQPTAPVSLVGEKILSPVRKESPSGAWHLRWWDLPACEGWRALLGQELAVEGSPLPVPHSHLESLGGGGNFRRMSALSLPAIVSMALYPSHLPRLSVLPGVGGVLI